MIFSVAEAEHCNGDFLWIDQIGQIKKACACLRRPSAKREGVGRRRQPPPDSKAADLSMTSTRETAE